MRASRNRIERGRIRTVKIRVAAWMVHSNVKCWMLRLPSSVHVIFTQHYAKTVFLCKNELLAYIPNYLLIYSFVRSLINIEFNCVLTGLFIPRTFTTCNWILITEPFMFLCVIFSLEWGDITNYEIWFALHLSKQL